MSDNRRLPRRARRLLIVIPVLLVCLVVVGLVVEYLYLNVGRIMDFRPVQENVHLPESNYSIHVASSSGTREIVLVNDADSSKTKVMNFGEDYTVLRHRDQAYLLLKADLTGSGGGYMFDVWNITGTVPRQLCTDCSSLDSGRSCTYPRLVDDSLEFERGPKCDPYPFALFFLQSGSIQRYRIDLK